MAEIRLTTFVLAAPELVFDLCRSIDLHKLSTAHTNEEAVSGVTAGLINLGETVTWRARHLLKTRTFTSRIISMERPLHFTDKMMAGDFKSFEHHHTFAAVKSGTLMTDHIQFRSPFGLIGRLADAVFMKGYLTSLLSRRNELVRTFAETGAWKSVLPGAEF